MIYASLKNSASRRFRSGWRIIRCSGSSRAETGTGPVVPRGGSLINGFAGGVIFLILAGTGLVIGAAGLAMVACCSILFNFNGEYSGFTCPVEL